MPPPACEVITHLPSLAPRAADSNKGTFGRVLIVAGSRGMSGAAVLCASAALRGGAGLVYLAVPQEVQPIVAAANPCYLTADLSQDEQGCLAESAQGRLLQLVQEKDVIGFGPGLSRSPAILALLTSLLTEVRVPIVIDADGLNALEGHTSRLKQRSGPAILTPHPGNLPACSAATLRGCRPRGKGWRCALPPTTRSSWFSKAMAPS